MKLLFSEAAPDYAHYIFPYALWAFPEPGETPATFFEAGFLPGTRQLDRFYMARHIRVKLPGFQPSSENRRVLRKCEHLKLRLVSRAEFNLTEKRRAFCQKYADSRFGQNVMSGERIESLFSAPVATHILIVEDAATGTEAGWVVLYLEEPRVAFYYYSFYDLTLFDRNLGLFIMTSAVRHFSAAGFQHLYLGTCYSERALYKTQFAGCEFFNGFRWSDNIRELKYLVARQSQHPHAHLLETADYLPAYYDQSLGEIAAEHGIRVVPAR